MAVFRAFEEIKTKPVELRHFLQNFPKGGDLHSHLSGAVYAESYLELASERDLCVDLETKCCQSHLAIQYKVHQFDQSWITRMNSASKTSIT